MKVFILAFYIFGQTGPQDYKDQGAQIYIISINQFVQEI